MFFYNYPIVEDVSKLGGSLIDPTAYFTYSYGKRILTHVVFNFRNVS